MFATDAKRMNTVMLTCGTYDAAYEFVYRRAVADRTEGPVDG